MKQLIEALLFDDHGISEEAYNALLDFLRSMDHNKSNLEALGADADGLYKYVITADATDGRFYFAD